MKKRRGKMIQARIKAFLCAAVMALLSAVPSYAAIAFRGQVTATAAATTTLDLTLTSSEVVAGDIGLAHISISSTSSTITPPSGWTLQESVDNGITVRTAVYINTAPTATTYQWTFSSSAEAVGGIVTYSGVNRVTRVNIDGSGTNAAGTSHDAPSVTTTSANDRLITFYAAAAVGTWTAPSGMTERYDVAGAALLSATADDKYLGTAGATGAQTATITVSGISTAVSVALYFDPIGVEYQVNTYTTGVQGMGTSARHVGAATDGSFVAVWFGIRSGLAENSIFGQRYTSIGTTTGVDFQVNTATVSPNDYPNIAVEGNGDFVVVWHRAADVFGQRFDSTGAAVGAEFQINTYATGSQVFPQVSGDSDGDFVAVWRSGHDGSSYGVFGQRYASSGTATGAEFQINTYTTGSQDPARCGMNTEPDGDFIVTWNGQDGDLTGVIARRYASSGTAVGAEFQVNTYTTGNQSYPDVFAKSAGDFIVTWQSTGQDGDGNGVFAQRYNSDGSVSGGEFQVNTATVGGQYGPTIACGTAATDPCLFAYVNAGSNIIARCDFSGGMCAEFQVNTYTTGTQLYPSVAALNTGQTSQFAVAWESNAQDGDSLGVFGDVMLQVTLTPSDTPTHTLTPTATATFTATSTACTKNAPVIVPAPVGTKTPTCNPKVIVPGSMGGDPL